MASLIDVDGCSICGREAGVFALHKGSMPGVRGFAVYASFFFSRLRLGSQAGMAENSSQGEILGKGFVGVARKVDLDGVEENLRCVFGSWIGNRGRHDSGAGHFART